MKSKSILDLTMAIAITTLSTSANAGWRYRTYPAYRSGPPAGAIIAGAILGAAALAGGAYAYQGYYPAPRRVLRCGVYVNPYGQDIQRCDWW